jgi:hypothetical protein
MIYTSAEFVETTKNRWENNGMTGLRAKESRKSLGQPMLKSL